MRKNRKQFRLSVGQKPSLKIAHPWVQIPDSVTRPEPSNAFPGHHQFHSNEFFRPLLQGMNYDC